MNPVELLKEHIDKKTNIPMLINPTSVATLDSCKLIGVNFKDVHNNSDKMTALAAVGHDELGFQSVMPYFSVIQEAAAFGANVNWGSVDEMPFHRKGIYKDPSEFKMPANLLSKTPMKTVIESIKMLKKRYGDSIIVIGKVMGPWTLSYHLRGVEDFLVETITEPEKATEFLNHFKQITKMFASAQFEAGADMITIADHVTGDLVGPETYKELLMPIHMEINKEFSGRNFILHCCGNTLDRIKYFADAGFKIFHFDSKNDITEAIAAAGEMLLTGCVNNADVLLNGTLNDVEDHVGDILAKGIHLVSPECAVPLKVKNTNLKHIAAKVFETGV